MKQNYEACIASIILFFGISLFQTASASHISGSDISYRCVGGNQYEISVRIYRDCSGILVSPTITVDVASTCGTQSVTCNQDTANSGVEVTPLCPSVSSVCQGGLLPGVEVYTYVGVVTLAANCGVYTISYAECCRNNSDNLLNATSVGYRVNATLNSDVAACQNSPVFTSLPLPYFCINQPVNYSNTAVDADGDSLVYRLTAPLDDQGANVAYAGTFSVSNPVTTSGGFNFDTTSGQTTFTPTAQGVYVVDVLILEYRNGVLIGSVMRDIQITVVNCSNSAPRVNNCLTPQNTTGAAVLDCNSLGVCPGQAISFTIGGRDLDGQPVTVTSNVAASFPGATLTTTAVTPDSVLLTFSWTPAGVDTGFRYFTVQFEDSACPYPGVQQFTYDITVLNGIDAGPDKFYCTGGDPVQVRVVGGNQFSWSTTAGMVASNTDSSVVLFAPSSTTFYFVESDLQGGCKTIDTITVFNVTSFTVTASVSDDTICLNSEAIITATALPATEGPFTYSWGPVNGGILNVTAQSTEVRPTVNTNYNVTVVSNAGCTVKDTVRVVIQGISAKVSILPSDNNVCPGSNVTLNTSISLLGCGPVGDTLNPCLPNSTSVQQDLGTGTDTANVNTTPYIGFYSDGRVQYLYRASELQALGLTAGAITSIGFNVGVKASTQPYDNFTIKMGCTSLDQLPNSFITAGLTEVFSPRSYSTALGWNTHTLNRPYNWDGFSNLILEICFDDTSWTGYDNVLYTPTAFTQSVLWDNGDLFTQSGCTGLTTPASGQNRPNTRFTICEAPSSGLNFSWAGSDGSVLPDSSAPVVSVNRDVTYNLTVTDGSCQGDTSLTLRIDTSVAIGVGSDTVICNTPVQLNAAVLHPASLYCIPAYDLDTIAYNAIGPSGLVSAGPTGDDVVSAAIPIPFAFNFFCTPVTQYYISTNGFISFSNLQGTGCCAGQSLPDILTPNNLIAMVWEDLNPGGGGNIDYFVSGTAPNRVAIIRWKNVSYFSVTGTVNGEIHLFETSNVIEIHVSSVTPVGQVNTLGIENAAGTVGYSPTGYNASGFTVSTPRAFRFTPQYGGNVLTGIQWTPSAGLSSDSIVNPVASPTANTTYIASATFTSGCMTRDTINIGVNTFPHTLTATPDSICEGDSAQLTFTGAGTSYAWTPANTLSSATAQSPVAFPTATTTYRVIANSSVGCAVTDSIIITVMTHGAITLGNDTAVCPYNAVSLTPTGGPYASYLWSTGATSSSVTTAGQTLASQSYHVEVSDGICSYRSDTVAVAEFSLNAVTVRPTGNTTFCTGDSVVLTADAGYQSYVWSNTKSASAIAANVSGSYIVTATDANDCTVSSAPITVTVNALPTVTLSGIADTLCSNAGAVTLTGGTPAGGIYAGTGVTGSTFTPATAGIGSHLVTYTFADGNNCTNSASETVAVVLCSSVSEADVENSFTLYPNPATDELIVQSDLFIGNTTVFAVHDVKGALVAIPYKQQANRFVFNVETLQAGVYWFNITLNGVKTGKKFVKVE